ncbi:MAG: lamin tail domain-containing protein [Trueperaceae bacterium]|nr:lamin tail domain-containing protein [Trueperaceae bacterium]
MTDIVDGDTFDLADGTRVRLAIVDTPEVRSDTQPCGPEATAFTGAFLDGATVAIYRPQDAPATGGFDRLLGEVVRVADGASLNVALVAAGLGRVDERFTAEDPDLAARLRRAAADAPTPECATDTPPDAPPDAAGEPDGTEQATGPVRIVHVRFDGPGDDVQPGDSEYVELGNDGDEPVDLIGWQVADDDGNTVTVGAGATIAPGGSLRVYSGPAGDESAPDRWYADRDQGYLNNSGGDDLRLLDPTGTTVATFRYDS